MPRIFTDDARFELDSAEIEQLMALLRGNDVEPGSMRNRLREFQKRFFPKSTSVGRGKRTLYGIQEMHEIAISFELADLDLSTPRCISIVEQNRAVLERVCTDAWDTLRRSSADMDERATQVGLERQDYQMHVAPSGITHDRGAYVAFGRLGRQTPFGSPIRHSRLTIDILTLVADINSVLAGERFRYLPKELDDAYIDWGIKVFGESVGAWTVGDIQASDARIAR